MLRNLVSASFALPLVIAVFAGCLEDTKSQDYHAAGQAGSFALGYAYDGKGVLGFTGYITIHANEAANTGDVVVAGMLNDQVWNVQFDRFAQQGNRTFQSGGVAANLMEHGDTKNGDTSIPQVHADLAGWGDAAVTVDGKTLPDALTGEARWVAHFMVITTGIRDDATKGIWNGGKTGAYNPAAPTDGLTTDGDNEIHLVLRSHATAPPAPIEIKNQSGPISTPQYRATHKWPNTLQNSLFDVNVSMTGAVAPQTRLTFTFKDPEGKTLKTVPLVQGLMGAPEPQRVQFPMNKTGMFSVEVSGNALEASYEIKGQQAPPGNVIMNLWWEDVLFGESAEQFEASQVPGGMDGMDHNSTPTAPTAPTAPTSPTGPTGPARR